MILIKLYQPTDRKHCYHLKFEIKKWVTGLRRKYTRNPFNIPPFSFERCIDVAYIYATSQTAK